MTGTIADGKPEAGAVVYVKRCARCHGADGDGKGKAAKMMDTKPTAFNSKEAWGKTTLKVKFQSTKCGGKAVGQSSAMPDYPEYTDQQIWDLLAYMQTFQSGK